MSSVNFETCDDCDSGIVEEIDELGEVTKYSLCTTCGGDGEVGNCPYCGGGDWAKCHHPFPAIEL